MCFSVVIDFVLQGLLGGVEKRNMFLGSLDEKVRDVGCK